MRRFEVRTKEAGARGVIISAQFGPKWRDKALFLHRSCFDTILDDDEEAEHAQHEQTRCEPAGPAVTLPAINPTPPALPLAGFRLFRISRRNPCLHLAQRKQPRGLEDRADAEAQEVEQRAGGTRRMSVPGLSIVNSHSSSSSVYERANVTMVTTPASASASAPAPAPASRSTFGHWAASDSSPSLAPRPAQEEAERRERVRLGGGDDHCWDGVWFRSVQSTCSTSYSPNKIPPRLGFINDRALVLQALTYRGVGLVFGFECFRVVLDVPFGVLLSRPAPFLWGAQQTWSLVPSRLVVLRGRGAVVGPISSGCDWMWVLPSRSAAPFHIYREWGCGKEWCFGLDARTFVARQFCNSYFMYNILRRVLRTVDYHERGELLLLFCNLYRWKHSPRIPAYFFSRSGFYSRLSFMFGSTRVESSLLDRIQVEFNLCNILRVALAAQHAHGCSSKILPLLFLLWFNLFLRNSTFAYLAGITDTRRFEAFIAFDPASDSSFLHFIQAWNPIFQVKSQLYRAQAAGEQDGAEMPRVLSVAIFSASVLSATLGFTRWRGIIRYLFIMSTYFANDSEKFDPKYQSAARRGRKPRLQCLKPARLKAGTQVAMLQTWSSARRDTAGERRMAVALRTRNTCCSSSAQPQITTAPKINTPRGKKYRKGESSNAQPKNAAECRHPGENQPRDAQAHGAKHLRETLTSTKRIPAKAGLAKKSTEDQRRRKLTGQQSPAKES
ncbi:hypothetical protein C8R44DRAFT_747927 [Mycena epipterygia]|nr:hypothetical protein C8R44DRAFT_747927 [Mycena epipterygia]